ncbi:DUF726-domain-containing protein [Fistulina hepatica ATCC 64428]|nr:DUF726-domain-containing protein [Fistulina hepatica ATCC 64428]
MTSRLASDPVADIFDDDGWEDMPIVREDTWTSGLDEEDQKKYHYVPSQKTQTTANATGNLLDVDYQGHEWRSKVDQNESEYTRLRVNEEDDVDDVHLRTRYLFDEDKAMTPLSQMQATKNMLTEAQRIAYVGLCALTTREMSRALKITLRKELKPAAADMDLWSLKIMGRLYYHMEIETQEQRMIESLAEHGVCAEDLVPSLMTTHTVANPEYDPEEAARKRAENMSDSSTDKPAADKLATDNPTTNNPTTDNPATDNPTTDNPATDNPAGPEAPSTPRVDQHGFQTTARVLEETETSAIPGVSTSLSATDERVTLDIRWTVLCDLFLLLIADSVYDARSRVLLERIALKLGLGWIDLVKFEARVTEALEIQEDVERMENQDAIEGTAKAARKRRYMMMGLATLGGGLVIGLSAGLLAPVIGLGLAGALTTVGITGTTGFLAGAGGAAMITTGGILTGSGIAVRGMARRTQQVRTFDILPLHNNKRVSCILTVPGFMSGPLDDVRLPFSVLDPVVGDVFSVLWEPEMITEAGSALRILTSEVLTQMAQTVLQATVMTALMTALQWPIILTKLGYLIDNPWSNALDRARAAGSILAEVLIQRHLGVRPVTLIGFSLGARVIFYALLELAKRKAFGIVQDAFLLGTTVTASQKVWGETRSVVSGRYVNAYARNDWVLNYLFRATSGGVGTVAGLRPVEGVPGLENVDVTDKISGHMSYRTFMPLILDQLGFPVFADYFDEPVEPDFEGDRIVVREEDAPKKKRWFQRMSLKPPAKESVSRPPGSATFGRSSGTPIKSATVTDDQPPRQENDDDLPPREAAPVSSSAASPAPPPMSSTDISPSDDSSILPAKHAGFDFAAMKEMIVREGTRNEAAESVKPASSPIILPRPTKRSESTPSTAILSSTSRFPAATSVSGPPPEISSILPQTMSLDRISDVDDRADGSRETAPAPDTARPIYSNSYSKFAYPSTSTLSGNAWAVPAPPVWEPSPVRGLLAGQGASQQSLSQNPFASVNDVSTTLGSKYPAEGLTFGSSDGQLMFGGTDSSLPSATPSTNVDTWRIPNGPGQGEKPITDPFSVNPWS